MTGNKRKSISLFDEISQIEPGTLMKVEIPVTLYDIPKAGKTEYHRRFSLMLAPSSELKKSELAIYIKNTHVNSTLYFVILCCQGKKLMSAWQIDYTKRFI